MQKQAPECARRIHFPRCLPPQPAMSVLATTPFAHRSAKTLREREPKGTA